jgi:hypothetical protein
LRALGFSQVFEIKPCRLFIYGVNLFDEFFPFLVALVLNLFGHFKSRFVGKKGDGLGKTHLFIFHHKGEDVAVFPTAVAFIKLVIAPYLEGRGFFVVERTARPKITAAPLNMNIGRYQIYDIYLVFDPIEKILRVTAQNPFTIRYI